ncbi:cold-shock protein [Nitrobacter sp.]|uniref:cold-shock protein n=1 Tax=Nitrobacter sp. TaxID=29420 RepID=UPI003F64B944
MIITKFTGTVSFWNEDRGFGFIQRASDRASFFAHISDVDEAFDSLAQGQRVEFAIADSDRKPGHLQAIDVVK